MQTENRFESLHALITKNSFVYFVFSHPFWTTLLLCIGSCCTMLLFMPFMLAFFFGPPVLITFYNIFFLCFPCGYGDMDKASIEADAATILFGSVYTYFYMILSEVMWEKAWYDQLYNQQLHAPIYTEALLTLAVIAAVGIIGYLLLQLKGAWELPPLLAALSIGAMYLLCALCIIWSIHVADKLPFTLVFALNIILICAKTVKKTVLTRKRLPKEPNYSSPILCIAHRLLSNAQNLPWLALILALPFFGIIICVLILFGQAPDSIIKVWTETADWTFSAKTAPQNIHYDQHYLCTVAAGGHKKVVKPMRVGMRHGHRVIVNRQLCIANAFEQLLEERVPRFHRIVRRIYDKYGYPIAKHIKSPYTADVIWFLMKPLEWMFLAVLYLCDKAPENRIAVQYPHAPLPKEYLRG